MSALTSYTVSTFLLMARRDGATISDAAINAAIDRIGSEGTTEDTGNALVAAVAGHLGDGSADAIAAGLSGLLGGSLKQGVIDGQENPLELIFTNSFFEAQKFVNLTGHIRGGYQVAISERWFAGLPADQKAIVMEGLVEMCRLEDKFQAEDESVLEQKLKAGGMTFNPVDIEKFQAALADFPKQFEKKWTPGFYDAVRNA